MKQTRFFTIAFLFAAVISLPSKKTHAQTSKKLDSLFQTLVQQDAFSGSILVADHGKSIYEKTYGYAKLPERKPLDKNTMFELASVSKQFTAMSIMQLHQHGKLKYEDSLKKYFPELPYGGVTINDLVHHTSGIPDFLGWGAKEIDVEKINFNKDILASLQKNHLNALFNPGESIAYSNTNYVLLALIVEKVSGLSFANYLQRNVFEPLGMAHTQVYGQRHAKHKISNYAYGYIYDGIKNKYLLNDSTEKYQYFLDGIAGPYGISSTTEDLLKWDQALYTEKLVNKQELENAFKPFSLKSGKPAELMGMPYGFGWMINESQKFYIHTGGYPGYATLIVRYYDKNQTIIILMNNYNRINIYDLGFNIENILNDRDFSIPTIKSFPKVIPLTAEKLIKFTGEYQYKESPDFKYTITNKGNQLFAQLTGQTAHQVYPDTQDTFFYTAVEAKIIFTEDKSGKVLKLTLQQNGRDLEFLKR